MDNLLKDQYTKELEDSILNNVLARELIYRIDPNYIGTTQREIQWHMRLLLIDWMMEVCDEFQLKRDTYHLAAYYTDMFLSR